MADATKVYLKTLNTITNLRACVAISNLLLDGWELDNASKYRQATEMRSRPCKQFRTKQTHETGCDSRTKKSPCQTGARPRLAHSLSYPQTTYGIVLTLCHLQFSSPPSGGDCAARESSIFSDALRDRLTGLNVGAVQIYSNSNLPLDDRAAHSGKMLLSRAAQSSSPR